MRLVIDQRSKYNIWSKNLGNSPPYFSTLQLRIGKIVCGKSAAKSWEQVPLWNRNKYASELIIVLIPRKATNSTPVWIKMHYQKAWQIRPKWDSI